MANFKYRINPYIVGMKKDTLKFGSWKSEVERVLDTLVTDNFDRLYNAGTRSKYDAVWKEISTNLYSKLGLSGKYSHDEDSTSKHEYVSSTIEIYAEEEFPLELRNERTYRFVMKYTILPKYSQDKWEHFESEQKSQNGIERKQSDERVRKALQKFEFAHSEHAH